MALPDCCSAHAVVVCQCGGGGRAVTDRNVFAVVC